MASDFFAALAAAGFAVVPVMPTDEMAEQGSTFAAGNSREARESAARCCYLAMTATRRDR